MNRNVYKAIVSVLLTILLILPLFPAGVLPAFADGDGSAEHPFLIKNDADLYFLQLDVQAGDTKKGVYYKLARDVEIVNNLVCIGSEEHPFEGVFDGDGHTISGFLIYSSYENEQPCGLFRCNNGTIHDLTVSGDLKTVVPSALIAVVNGSDGVIRNCRAVGYVTCSETCGGIVSTNNGEIIDCVNEAQIDAAHIAGGVCGYSTGRETGCVNLAAIDAINYVGGIVGRHTSAGAIENCRNEAPLIKGNSCVGGICGEANSYVTNCVNRAKVEISTYYAGGIVGSNFRLVRNCVNYGDVKASGHMAGGVSGFCRAGAEGCENHGNVYAGYEAGGITGYTNNKISYCCNTGSVTADGKWAGGIAADSGGSNEFYLCFNTGTVRGGNKVGGIGGDMNQAAVKRCYNAGSVTATGDEAGGIAGVFEVGSVSDCRNDGSVKGEDRVGGIVGSHVTGTINRCLFTGRVTGDDYVGTIIGLRHNVDLVYLNRNHYYLYSGHPSGIGDWDTDEYQSEEIKGLTEEQYKNGDDDVAYIDWDIGSVWYMTDNGPRLVGVRTVAEDGYVIISTVEDFLHFRDCVNLWGMTFYGVNVKLKNDIDLSSVSDQVPVAYPGIDSDNVFSGLFNGNDHTISGVNISTGDFAGFFGCVDGEIKRLTVRGTVSAGYYTGGLVGDFSGNMESCVFDGSVTGKASVGGLVGRAEGGTIYYSVVHGSVKGLETSGNKGSVGGIVGELTEGGDVRQCEADVSVIGAGSVGGVAGELGIMSAISDCSHVGAVTGGEEVGGVVGLFNIYAELACCYHYTGRVSGGSNNGGVVGRVDGMSTAGVKKCYYLTGTVYDPGNSQVDRGIGGTGMPFGMNNDASGVTESLTTSAFCKQRSFDDWDFDNLWSMSAVRPELTKTHAIVTFDANGGEGRMDPVFYGWDGGQLPYEELYRAGFNFYCWNTAPDNSGDRYYDGAVFEGMRSVTLYAIWLECTSAAYIAEDGEEHFREVYVFPTDLTVIPGEWYCVEGNVTRSGRFTVDPGVTLILADGCALSADAGVRLTGDGVLKIYAQRNGTGRLAATGSADCAGIGGSKGESGGTLTVCGGVIEATGGKYGAGIGGGDTGDGGTVVIKGGHITATGTEGAAGIGGGDYGNGGTVYISGGVVNANGSTRSTTDQSAAGIGAGRPKADGSEPRSPGFCMITGGNLTIAAGPCSPHSPTGAQAIGVNFADVDALTTPENVTGEGIEPLVLGDSICVIGGWTSSDIQPALFQNRVYTCRNYPYVRLGIYDRFDINRDVSVNINDVTTLLDILAGYDLPVVDCDLNDDDALSISDVTELLNYLAYV